MKKEIKKQNEEKEMKEVNNTSKKGKKNNTNNETLDVVYILDRSGSMSDVEEETIKGYNNYLLSQKDNKVKLTTVLFDDDYEMITKRIDISKVKELTNKTYYPRGCTALYDAIGKTINYIDKEDTKKVLFIINTDGLENASSDYDKKKICNLIKKHKDWEFMYIGANIDSYSEAQSIGIKASNISNYKKDKKGTKILYDTLSSCTMMMAKCDKIDTNWKEDLEKYMKENEE